MKTYYLLFATILNYSFVFGQAPENDVKTIKVKHQSAFVKAAFNEADYKVIAVDKFGNPYFDAIKSFSVYYIENKTPYESKIIGSVFTEKIINFFTKKKKFATKICITKIMAQTEDGHLETLPDLCDIVIFPECKSAKRK